MSTTNHDTEIAPHRDRPVAQPPRELLPVTRLISIATLRVIDGVLTAVRVLRAA